MPDPSGHSAGWVKVDQTVRHIPVACPHLPVLPAQEPGNRGPRLDRSDPAQGLLQIGDQVMHILNADRQPHQSIIQAQRAAHFGRH